MTHHHPDHIGLAGWLQRRCGSEVWMSRETHDAACVVRTPASESVRQSTADFAHRHGVDDAAQMVAFWCGDFYQKVVSEIPDVSRFVDDNEILIFGDRSWRTLQVNGHAQGHLALVSSDAGLLISGDQILPKISPNISVYPANEQSDPLGEYLASLDRVEALGEPMVLPSHGRVFSGLAKRCDQLRAQHRQKLDRSIQLCRQQAMVSDVLVKLYPQAVDSFNMALAFGETLAHLTYLERQGQLIRTTTNGRCLFEDPGTAA